MNQPKPQSFIFLITGLVLGVILGILSAWFLFPLDQTNNHPQSLRADHKLRYRVLVAIAYVANGDIGRAEARLGLLGEPITSLSLASEAQLFLGEGEDENTARALALLAAGLENPNQTMSGVGIGQIPFSSSEPTAITALDDVTANPSGTVESTVIVESTSTRTPMPTFTPRPTQTLEPTQGAPFVLSQYPLVCEDEYQVPTIEVFVWDALQRPVAGMEIIATWEGGEDHFYTGLKLDQGLGFADFEMTAGQFVEIALIEGDQKTPPLDIPYCINDDGESYFGVWQVLFIQP